MLQCADSQENQVSSPGNITILLQEVHAGRAGALDELMDVVYSDLERIAVSHLTQRMGDRADRITIEPAGLVNETFLKMIKQRNTFDNRGHFFAIATRVMLRVLCDYQRERFAVRRGGRRKRITLSLDRCLDHIPTENNPNEIEIEALVNALNRLEELDARQAEVVKLRVVWGLDITEIADSLGISDSTVKRDWRFAKAWLLDEVALAGA